MPTRVASASVSASSANSSSSSSPAAQKNKENNNRTSNNGSNSNGKNGVGGNIKQFLGTAKTKLKKSSKVSNGGGGTSPSRHRTKSALAATPVKQVRDSEKKTRTQRKHKPFAILIPPPLFSERPPSAAAAAAAAADPFLIVDKSE